jgi:hypothetical protein
MSGRGNRRDDGFESCIGCRTDDVVSADITDAHTTGNRKRGMSIRNDGAVSMARMGRECERGGRCTLIVEHVTPRQMPAQKRPELSFGGFQIIKTNPSFHYGLVICAESISPYPNNQAEICVRQNTITLYILASSRTGPQP